MVYNFSYQYDDQLQIQKGQALRLVLFAELLTTDLKDSKNLFFVYISWSIAC